MVSTHLNLSMNSKKVKHNKQQSASRSLSIAVPESFQLETGKKNYFASDFHLGIDGKLAARERELQIVRWLDEIKADAQAIFLLGDLFEFWFEYKRAIPRGYVRFLGKLAEIRDLAIPIYVFTGNHDMWMKS